MIYTKKYPKLPFLVLGFTYVFLLNISTTLVSLKIAIILIVIMPIFIEHQLQVEKEKVKYQVLLFSKPIYNKTMVSTDIQKIIFKRVGWVTKAAIIKTKMGLNIRIVDFNPKQVYFELISHAEENKIDVYKEKDFNTLMKMG